MMPSSSKAWNYVAVLLLWLYWSSVLLGADGATTDPVEVAALGEIKKSLVDSYKNLSNWNRGDPCTSNWTGVLCFNEKMEDGYLHVRKLQLLNMNLSGTLSLELGRLSHLEILDFMWNNISGSIPKEIGNIKTLELLLLNGNQLTGSLPEKLGYLPNLDRLQIDENHISGPLPASFANLNKTKHFHMNNNSISGQIPPELSRLPSLVHFILDNNNLSGYLPPEFYQMPKLEILQVDNNNFEGSTIPTTYAKMSKLLKLSLRNCGLQGEIPDLSAIPHLCYLDLSSNQLNGSIPRNKLSLNITTINLSNNSLTGTIPTYFADLPRLQKLDFQNNQLSNISGSINLPANVSLWLRGNPVCSNANTEQFCGSKNDTEIDVPGNLAFDCPHQTCPSPFEYSPTSPADCFCAAPLIFGYRLKSPGFSYFNAYKEECQVRLSSSLNLEPYQLNIQHFEWEGPRLGMDLKLYPVHRGNNTNYNVFNDSEVQRIVSMFTGWNISHSDIFGPYELLSVYPYMDVSLTSTKSGISKGALAGIILGAIAGAAILSAIISLIIVRLHLKDYRRISKKGHSSTISIKIEGVRSFTYEEMALATNNFNNSTQVGQGGYGKVYKGILADGTVVAIKRAQEGSLQGEKEFLTEIQFLSRLHHRNLLSLVGYCDEEREQMLVYEFMVNGNLRNHLSVKSKEPLGFAMRLSIALGSAKGILYLHTEADPPVFHRDIKASNILLDHKFTAKVADFGLSRLGPVADTQGIVPSYVSTVVKGTPGYLDPEYFLTDKLTDKSDVYSLGVVFLELLTGMQPISHGKNIVREVNVSYQSGMIFSVIDGRMGSYPSECVEKFVTLALECCQDKTDVRPSMAEVVRELENIWLMMPDSDSKTTEFTSTDQPNKEVSPPYPSFSVKQQPYASLDISGSNLVSGVVPSFKPR